MLTYNKFMEIVPEETQEFVEELLPYLDYFIIQDNEIYYEEYDEGIDKLLIKKICLFFKCLTEIEKYSSIKGKYNFITFKFNWEEELYDDKEDIFNQLSNLFLIYENESDYYSLLPLDLIANLKKELPKNKEDLLYSEKEEFETIFSNIEIYRFFEDIEEKAKNEKQEYKKKLELEVFENLPLFTIEYLKMAVRLRTTLENIFKDSNTEFLTKSNVDYVPLSLLLAIYHYNNKETEAIVKILEKNNINLEKIENKIRPRASIIGNVRNKTFDINILKQEYTKYFNQDLITNNTITITNIFTNLLKRDITKSLIIEKVLNNGNDEYKKIYDALVDDTYDFRKKLNDFYQELPKESRAFIEFSSKTYKLIKIKMSNDLHNKELLLTDQDAIVLSLYIANCHYNRKIAKYFNEYGNVTLDKVLKLINLDITKEEIENTELNKKLIIEIYERYIYRGRNEDLINDSKKINIDEISSNICSSDFTKSLILKNSFDILSNKNISNNFFNEMDNYFYQKEQEEENKISQELFMNLPLDTIEFLEDTSRIHNFLLNNKENWYQNDLQVVSLLCSALLQGDSIADFLAKKIVRVGSPIEGILKIYLDINLKITNKNYFNNYNKDVKVLQNEYQCFIFNGVNKDIERDKITVFSILKNIFSKEFNNSIELEKLFDKFNIRYLNLVDFEKDYQKYLESVEYEKVKKEAQMYFCRMADIEFKYFIEIIVIHKRIANYLKENNITTLKESDIEKISVIINFFNTNYNNYEEIEKLKYFCKKNKLTLSNIIKYCNLENLDLSNINVNKELDYGIVVSNYKKYFTESYSISKFVNQVVKENINNSTILKDIIIKFDGNYDIFIEEITTLKEHELTLSERIKILTELSVNSIDTEDMNSILNFGNCLSTHSKYIYDELPKLMLNDTSNKATETINEIINRVYIHKEEKKKSLFRSLFLIDEDDKDSKLSLNPEAIKELKETININIDTLSKELLVFDKIRKYIEIYQKKNYECLIFAKDTVEKIEKEKPQEIEDDNNYASFLSSNTHLRIIQEKLNRFATSNQLMKQELFKINQIIINHFITINTLEMARDDLLPLIGSELAINIGRNTENSALELSQSVMGLFQSLLTRNADTAQENIERISNIGINNDTLELINRDISNYMLNLNLIVKDNDSKTKVLTNQKG